MKLLIEVPTWLGDAVMATPAIENLLNHYRNLEVTIMGSYVSTQLFLNHPKVKKVVVDDSKIKRNRFIALYKFARSLGEFDLVISFRSSLSSKVLLFFLKSKRKFNYKKIKQQKHQVLKYNNFINKVLKTNYEAKDLKIYSDVKKYDKPTLGLNPGASYGSAKRWYPEEFAKVAIKLSNRFDIVIFGGPLEIDIAQDIEEKLKKNNIKNYTNLAGKTKISELIKLIAGLDYFITNDSGPMHIAAVFKVPTIAIFGPTKYIETSQWNNPKGIIVSKNLVCSPCMKRTCPLKHHDCMKKITAADVLCKVV